MPAYLLPNHPSLISPDPLGICSLDEESISHSKLLSGLIQKAEEDFAHLETADETRAWTERLEELLQDIAYSLHAQSDLSAAGLQKARLGSSSHERCAFRSHLFHSTLQLDSLFPDASLTQLSEKHIFAAFSPPQMDCLLAHMFLGTLQTPEGNTWGRPGFGQYYDWKIVRAVANTAIPYLETVVDHFIHGGYAATMGPEHRFTFHFSSAASMPAIMSCDQPVPQLPVTLVDKPSDPSSKKDAFVLVAANAEPGPGAGGTHEERLVGQSPAMAIASILIPLVAEDAAVVTSPLPVHTTWEGHGRDAKMISLLPVAERPARRYIIADALPLDLSHRQSGLLERNVNREVRKLYAAFHGARQAGPSKEELTIEMPPWGCGAFGGSLKTKMPCMVMAAGLAGLTSQNLELLVPRDREYDLWKSPREALAVRELYAQLVGRDVPTASALSLIKNFFSKSK